MNKLVDMDKRLAEAFQSLVYWRGEMNPIVGNVFYTDGMFQSLVYWRGEMNILAIFALLTLCLFQSLVYWRGEMNLACACLYPRSAERFNPWFIGGGK